MRTTINLRDEALALARQKALELDCSLGDIVSEAILATYRDRLAKRSRRRYDLPVSGEGGLQPGVNLDCSAALEDLLDDRS